MSVSKERRDQWRQECDATKVVWGDEPDGAEIVIHADELRALLDLADERDRYRALLVDARAAIASLPEGALGYDGDEDGYWPIRDEFLWRIDAALEGKHD